MMKSFTKEAEQMFEAAQDVKMPESVKAFAEDSLAKTRAAYDMMSSAARSTGEAFEGVATVAAKGARTFGEKVASDFAVNTEAAFDAASKVVASRSLPEAFRVQAEFMQNHLQRAGEQTRELYELSTAIARTTFEHMNAATQKSLDQVKKAS